jgi:uncharacterized protein YdeI (YjbR/CyaY-like superfamily)
MPRTLYVADRAAWRRWLAEHHAAEKEIWLIYYKKHTGRPRIPYEDAVEEALCFGWIDSIVKKLDNERFAQKFTPRQNRTKWSALNRRRARKMIDQGRMTRAGLAKIDPPALAEGPPRPQDELAIPAFVKRALRASPGAWKKFTKLSPSHRRRYIAWILEAKTEETRARRIQHAIEMLKGSEGELAIPAFLEQALRASPRAWQNFTKLAPSYRRQYVGWILHAKREETRARRIREAIGLLERNQKLGLK